MLQDMAGKFRAVAIQVPTMWRDEKMATLGNERNRAIPTRRAQSLMNLAIPQLALS